MKMEVGAYNKLPHYAVIGTPIDFYIWKNEEGSGTASQWIQGASAFEAWHKLCHYKVKNKTEFVRYLKVLHMNNIKMHNNRGNVSEQIKSL